MGKYKTYGTGMTEKERYGDLLKNVMKKQEAKEKSMLDAINGVIEWGKQANKERDKQWEQNDKFRKEMFEKAKQRFNKEYKI